MKTIRQLNRRRGGGRGARGVAAFTMVEIAICIAIVAFAMVAIIGVMPTGFQVQKQNREDTIINQEGNFWLDTLRSGSVGLDYLTNYVEMIHCEALYKRPQDTKFRQMIADYSYGAGFRNGRDIVGLLSLPRFYEVGGHVVRTPSLYAYVRALSGSAAEKTPKNDFAFMYRLTPEITQFNPAVGLNTNFAEASLPVAERLARSNLFVRANALKANLYELRLTLEWPVYPRGGRLSVGGQRKMFRTLVGGSYWITNVDYLARRDLFFLQPSEYVGD